MHRAFLLAVPVLAVVFSAGGAVQAADPFDGYTGAVLRKAPKAEGVQEVKQLTPTLALDHNTVIPDSNAALIVVETNTGQFAKLLVQGARKRLNDAERTVVSTFSIDRYVTYKVNTERTVAASGQNIMLFDGFHFSADLGSVVPEKVGGDLRYVHQEKDGESIGWLEPVGKARLFLITKPLPEAMPAKAPKFVLATPFEPKNFNGRFKLADDGRRSGTLTLKVNAEGDVTGTYISDLGGEEYEVTGKVGPVKHAIQFSIKLPRTEQSFQGLMFTGNGLVIAGTTRLLDREMAFTATRIEEE